MSFVEGLILGALIWAFVFGLLAWVFSPQTARRSAPSPSPTSGEFRERPPRPSDKIKARTGAEVKDLIETFTPAKVLKIYDGDTVLVAKGWSRVTIRLDSIDCPEGGQSWGDNAKYGLIKLIGGRTVHLEQYGADDFGRTLATLYVRHANGRDWQNVNERMVTLGHAWVMRQYYDHLPPDRQDKLNKLEAWAKSKNVGLWGTPDPMPPWQWRKEVWRPSTR
jgi:micrococcal nuclease